MKRSNKKLIALLSVCCLATAGLALAGCTGDPGKNGTNGKTAYEIAVENGFEGTEAEWLESLKAHEHTYDDKIEEVIKPTGMKGGLAYKACTAEGCDHQEFIALDTWAGVIPQNPYIIQNGETATVRINDYDSKKYGKSSECGEKGVMYFALELPQTGYVSLPTNFAGVEGVHVSYEFHVDGAYDFAKAARDYFVADDETETKYAYIKVTFTADEGYTYDPYVEVTGQVAVLEEGLVANKITVPVDALTEDSDIILYNEWGDEPLFSVEDSENGEGNYIPFDDKGVATLMLDPSKNYTFEISNLKEGATIISDTAITFPVDGSHDNGAEYTVVIGKEYAYSVTVKTADGAGIEGVTVKATNGAGEELKATADPDGAVAFDLPERINEKGEIVFDWKFVAEGDFGFGYGAPAEYTADLGVDGENDYAVTMTTSNLDVATWAADGTAYDVAVGTTQVLAKITVDKALKYNITLFNNDSNMFSQGTYTINVNGKTRTAGDPYGWNMKNSYTRDFEFVAGVNEIMITYKTGSGENASYDTKFPFAVKVELVPGQVVEPEPEVQATPVTLDANKQAQVVDGTEYAYEITEAGYYKLTIVNSSDMGNTMVYKTKADCDPMPGYGDVWLDCYNNSDPSVTTEVELAVEDKLTFYIYNYGEGALNVTVKIEKVTAEVPAAQTPVTLDANKQAQVVDGIEYAYEVTEAGYYKLTIVSSNDLDNTMVYATKAACDPMPGYGDVWLDCYNNSDPSVTTKLQLSVDDKLTFYIYNYGSEEVLNVTVQIEKVEMA